MNEQSVGGQAPLVPAMSGPTWALWPTLGIADHEGRGAWNLWRSEAPRRRVRRFQNMSLRNSWKNGMFVQTLQRTWYLPSEAGKGYYRY